MFAGERVACRNPRAQDLVFAAIDFQELARAAVNLLTDGSSKAHDIGGTNASGREVNRFGAKGEECGAGSF